MNRPFCIFLLAGACGILAGCSKAKPTDRSATVAIQESSAPRIYVTNEVSGDLSVIDSGYVVQ